MNGISPAVLGEDKKEKSPVSTPGTRTNMVKVETSPVSIPASVSEELIPSKRRRVPPKKLYEEINRTNEKKRVSFDYICFFFIFLLVKLQGCI